MSSSNKRRVQRSTTEHDPPASVTVVQGRGTGHAIDGTYVHEMWLPVIGPTAFLLAGQLVDLYGYELVTELALSLGVGENRWRQALDRLVRFGLAAVRLDPDDSDRLIVTVLDRWPDAPEPANRLRGAEQ